MNRRVLAALLTLADIHEVKETEGGNERFDDAYGRGGYVLDKLSDEDQQLYQSLAQALCEKAMCIGDDPEGEAMLTHVRDRTLPRYCSEPMGAPYERMWTVVVREPGEPIRVIAWEKNLFDSADASKLDADSWRNQTEMCGDGKLYDTAIVLVRREPPKP